MQPGYRQYGKFECQKDIHFKTKPRPVAKNATPRPPAGNCPRALPTELQKPSITFIDNMGVLLD